ncbi:hypothetical protein GCM10027051_17360 [Niabella terrae]
MSVSPNAVLGTVLCYNSIDVFKYPTAGTSAAMRKTVAILNDGCCCYSGKRGLQAYNCLYAIAYE